MEEIFKNAIKGQIEWLEASKDDFNGETRTNALFQIEHLKNIIN
jgi:hypothetical protein